MLNNKNIQIGSLISLSRRNFFSLLLSLFALVLLIPGLTLPLLTIKSGGTIKAAAVKVNLNINFYDTSNSILQTVESLFNQGFRFVACMIFIFSVVVPTTKGILCIYMICLKNIKRRKKIFSFLNLIGKWSMCDVFIAAIFLLYLSSERSQAQKFSAAIMGFPIDVNTVINTSAKLEMGFYFFLAYCLLSLFALQLYKNDAKPARQA